MESSIRIVVIDDHLVTRKGVIALLDCNPRIQVRAEGSAGNHVLELLEEHQPDVLITDLQMPAHQDEPKGALFEPISTLKKGLQKYQSLSIIVLSQEQNVQTIQSLAEIGVKGYLLKTDDFAAVLGNAVEMIHFGTMYFSPEVQEVINTAPKIKRSGKLTGQQLAVLRAIVRSPGASREKIAASLHISPSTLQKHINQMLVVMGARNMIECVLKGIRAGLVDFDTGEDHRNGR
jgi:DNA-binding NarL/FixJ family response regulator